MGKRENINKMASKQRNFYHVLNADQKAIFDLVLSLLNHPTSGTGRAFFITGSAGTGKTFVLNAVLGHCQFANIPFTAVAYTRMGACLLKEGRTVYSRFKMPWRNDGDFVSHVTDGSQAAADLYESQVIVWDQAPSCHKGMLTEVDQLLQRLMNNSHPFGGKIMLLAGDFRETLPISKGASEQETVFNTILYAKSVWSYVKQLELTQNMRFKRDGDFEWVRDVGSGAIQCVDMPINCHVETESQLIDWVFGCPVKPLDPHAAQSKIILTMTNANTKSFNRACLERMPGRSYYFQSPEIVRKLRPNQPSKQIYSINYFNRMLPKDFPPAHLDLKIDCPIVLKRWYKDLQPGTRLTVSQIHKDGSIKATVITGPYLGESRTIRRVNCVLRLNNQNLQLQRYQLPVDLCFAMTIHKAQGLTFDQVGLSLPQPVYSHGQLYMALSRVRNLNSLKVWVMANNKQNFSSVPNIVYPGVITY